VSRFGRLQEEERLSPGYAQDTAREGGAGRAQALHLRPCDIHQDLPPPESEIRAQAQGADATEGGGITQVRVLLISQLAAGLEHSGGVRSGAPGKHVGCLKAFSPLARL